jgi:hypothetical protein
LPTVYDPKARPRIRTGNATTEDLINQVQNARPGH